MLPVYPYLPGVNPDFQTVSVDEKYYVEWLESLQSSSVQNAFTETSGGSRPLTLLLIHSLQTLTGLSAQLVVRFLPLLLGPMLVAAVYYFVRLGTGNNRNAASLSALFTVLSFQFVVGIYAGFFANWLALVTSYIALLFLFRAWERRSRLDYLILLSITITTLFVHVYTWGYLMAVMILFTLLSYVMQRKERTAC